MNILLAGINNYFGKQFKSFLLQKNDEVSCLVRKDSLFKKSISAHPNLNVIDADLIREKFSKPIPDFLDAAYYFGSYTSEQRGMYREIELLSLQNYIKKLRRAYCSHLIYVISLRSPINQIAEELLKDSYIPYTIVRTSNLIGKSSSLMNIFEQMSNKPIIFSNTRLAKSRCQPIAISDALAYLNFITSNPDCFNQSFDLCGPDTVSYREMLRYYLKYKGTKKIALAFPYINQRFSTYWLSRNSGISKAMASAFTENIKGDIFCINDKIHTMFPHKRLSFEEALGIALDK